MRLLLYDVHDGNHGGKKHYEGGRKALSGAAGSEPVCPEGGEGIGESGVYLMDRWCYADGGGAELFGVCLKNAVRTEGF